jgi:predicted phage tail component-like protein
MTFNNRKETDIPGLFLIDRKIYAPTKKKIKVEVPFMHGSYDFSTVGSGGEIVYTQRTIECKFGLKAISKDELQVRYEQFLNWLYDVGQSQLIFDDLSDVYFLAEIEKEPSWREIVAYGETTVTFVCQPFKYGIDYEGDKDWDSFNFLTDYLQEDTYSINGSSVINIYNPGRIVIPDVIVSSNMSCTVNGYTTNFTSINYKDYNFKLLNGTNSISVVGNGNIQFRFRKELL